MAQMNALLSDRLAWTRENKVVCTQQHWELSTVFDVLQGRGFKPSTFLEVGSGGGGSMYCYTSLLQPNSTIVSVERGFRAGNCIDTLSLVIDTLKADGHNAEWIRGQSEDSTIIEAVKAKFPNGVEFMHIDANHMRDPVTLDFQNYIPLLKRGGIALFHDTFIRKGNCEVWQVWPEFRKEYLWAEFVGGPAGFGIGLIERR